MQKKKKKYGPEAKNFIPANPEKYKGKWPIVCRSSLEKRAFFFLMDTNPAIFYWTSESLVIPYYDMGRKEKRRYFTDLTFKIRDTQGRIQTYVVEVKMEGETHRPQRGRKQQKTFINECYTYATNISKWKAAKSFCDAKGWKFVLWTEKGMRIYDPNSE